MSGQRLTKSDILKSANSNEAHKSVASVVGDKCFYTKESGLVIFNRDIITVEHPHLLLEKQGAHRRQDKDTDLEAIVSKRSSISDFTRESQTRFIKKCAAWETDRRLIFITLTYPRSFPTTLIAKSHFNKFLKTLTRRYPDVTGPWRLEYQKRGAPHFHLVLDNLCVSDFVGTRPDIDAQIKIEKLRKEINSIWKQSRGSDEKAFTQTDYARSAKRGKYYLTKELGKSIQSKLWRPEDASIKHHGRFWGWINNNKSFYSETVLKVPLTISERIRNIVQRDVETRMLKTGKLQLVDGVIAFHNKDVEYKRAKLQRYMLYKSGDVYFKTIWAQVWTDADIAILGYDPRHGAPPITDFEVYLTG